MLAADTGFIGERDLRLSREIKRLGRFEGLIIDDLGYIQQSRDDMEVVFTLLAERYERGSVLMTTPAVLEMGGHIQRRDDDGGGDQPAGASQRRVDSRVLLSTRSRCLIKMLPVLLEGDGRQIEEATEFWQPNANGSTRLRVGITQPRGSRKEDPGRIHPGFFELDMVAHRGKSVGGSHAHSLVLTDIGLDGRRRNVARERTLISVTVEEVRVKLPFPMLGLDVDNDSAFINETVVGYCERLLASEELRANERNNLAKPFPRWTPCNF